MQITNVGDGVELSPGEHKVESVFHVESGQESSIHVSELLNLGTSILPVEVFGMGLDHTVDEVDLVVEEVDNLGTELFAPEDH